MSLVWERAPYTAGSLLVLLALADWANDEGFCWPSIPKIAGKTRLERRSIQYIIRKLQGDGLLHIEEGRGRKHQHQYTINVQNLRLLPNLIKGEIDDSENVQSTTQKAQSTTEKVQPIAPDPSVSVKEIRKIEPPVAIDPPFQSQAFAEALTEFESHRREMRKALHTTGRKRLYEKLAVFGETDATLALQEAVANGWVGVFRPERRNGHAGNGAARPALSDEAKARKQAELRERMTGQRGV